MKFTALNCIIALAGILALTTGATNDANEAVPALSDEAAAGGTKPRAFLRLFRRRTPRMRLIRRNFKFAVHGVVLDVERNKSNTIVTVCEGRVKQKGDIIAELDSTEGKLTCTLKQPKLSEFEAKKTKHLLDKSVAIRVKWTRRIMISVNSTGQIFVSWDLNYNDQTALLTHATVERSDGSEMDLSLSTVLLEPSMEEADVPGWSIAVQDKHLKTVHYCIITTAMIWTHLEIELTEPLPKGSIPRVCKLAPMGSRQSIDKEPPVVITTKGYLEEHLGGIDENWLYQIVIRNSQKDTRFYSNLPEDKLPRKPKQEISWTTSTKHIVPRTSKRRNSEEDTTFNSNLPKDKLPRTPKREISWTTATLPRTSKPAGAQTLQRSTSSPLLLSI